MTTDLIPQDLPAASNLDRPMTVQEVSAQALAINQILNEVMVEGIHYGKIPGTGDKPTLLQPGAEKICATFRLAPKYQVDDLSEPHANLYRYRVTCSLHTIRDGYFVGAAVGEASTAEEKYSWERAVCAEHYEATDPTRRRIKFKRDDRASDGYLKIEQVARNAADLANTVLKIATKRAYISATRAATAASDLLEVDLDEEAVAEVAKQDRHEEAPKPKAKAKPAPILPYGGSKGKAINDPAVPLEHLKGFVEGKERALAEGKVAAKFVESDKLLVSAIQAEIQAREAAGTGRNPAEAAPGTTNAPQATATTRPPMDDSSWVDTVNLMVEHHRDAYDRTLKQYKVQSSADLAPADRWAFYETVTKPAAK